jgi:hypothetical protein
MGTLTQQKQITLGLVLTSLSISILTTTIYVTEDVYGYLPQSGQYIRVSDGLMDACTQSGYSTSYCGDILYGTNPGGYCNGLQYCPPIQDPGYTYSDPYNAMKDSQQQYNQYDNAIKQWDYLYPPGWSR